MADEVELIELIDGDDTAFGGAPRPAMGGIGEPGGPDPEAPAGTATGTPHRPPRRIPTRLDRRARLGMAACVLAAVALGVALLVVAPWQPDLRLGLTDERVTTSELSSRLVFGDPPAELRTASVPDGTGQTIAEWAADSLGYFFVEPGASFDPAVGTGSWFAFYAKPADDPTTGIVVGQDQIAGAPAETSDESQGEIVELYWGPVDGWVFRGVAAHSSIEAAKTVAEQLRVVDGEVVVLDRRVLGAMQPFAGFGDYVMLATLYQYAHDFGRALDGLVGLYYGFSGQSVVSVPGNESALDTVQFILSRDAQERTVHGRRAFGFTKGAGPFGEIDRSTVIWWEGGRLVLVAGDGDLDATFALAESVRPATDEEWASVEALVAADTVDVGTGSG